MSINRSEDLKEIAKHYGELRLKTLSSLRKINDYSMILFKAFLQYVDKRRGEGLDLHVLLEEFLSGELALNKEEDRNTRLSLARRFCNLAKKHVRSPEEQASILRYIEY
ncbi:MAG: hypothetical protein FGF52_00685 [Candidatus Brockarchaeota archaeon]|nr:hypothetical protein [Candidatus Brockarchaeota archaeon]